MDLGAPVVPRRARGIVSDRSAQISAQATSDFAGNINNIVQQVAEREDKFSYASAKSSLLQADLDTRSSLENDPDWTTYESRYQEAMTKQLGEASKLVRGNRDRALFQMDAKLDMERGAQEIRAASKRKEIDWGRADTDTTLEALRSSAIGAPDQATSEQALMAAKDKIIGAQQRGYMTEQEATNAFQTFRDSFAAGKLEVMTPADRIKALNDPKSVARFLQPDVQKKLLEAAKNENRDVVVKAESQAHEDVIVAKYGGNWSKALETARAVTDPEVRDATVSRIKSRWAEAKQIELEAEDNALEQATAFMNEGGKFENMPLSLKNRLKPSTLNSIRSFSEQGGAPKHSDQAEMLRIDTIYADDPQAFGEQNPLDWKPHLSQSDWEQREQLWAKVRSGTLDGKDSGFRTKTQIKNEVINGLFGSPNSKERSKNAEKSAKFNDDFESRLREAQEENNGKPVKSDQVKKILDDMTVEVALSGWFGGKKRAYELTDEDIASSGGRGTKSIVVPKADRDQIISVLRNRNIDLTEENILRMYTNAK